MSAAFSHVSAPCFIHEFEFKLSSTNRMPLSIPALECWQDLCFSVDCLSLQLLSVSLFMAFHQVHTSLTFLNLALISKESQSRKSVLSDPNIS